MSKKYEESGQKKLLDAAECYFVDPWEASRLIGEVDEMLRRECNRRLVRRQVESAKPR